MSTKQRVRYVERLGFFLVSPPANYPPHIERVCIGPFQSLREAVGFGK